MFNRCKILPFWNKRDFTPVFYLFIISVLGTSETVEFEIKGGGSHPFLHKAPANFESYAKNCYAKLCKSMQNYAKICKIMQKLFKNSRNLK